MAAVPTTPLANGSQAINNAYQRTANALSKNIRKNKAKLKYGTFVYLVNSREKKN